MLAGLSALAVLAPRMFLSRGVRNGFLSNSPIIFWIFIQRLKVVGTNCVNDNVSFNPLAGNLMLESIFVLRE